LAVSKISTATDTPSIVFMFLYIEMSRLGRFALSIEDDRHSAVQNTREKIKNPRKLISLIIMLEYELVNYIGLIEMFLSLK